MEASNKKAYDIVTNLQKDEVWYFSNLKYFLPLFLLGLTFYQQGQHAQQARIHTGFHCFTEMGQIFHNKYIFQ